jgi:hypothetical protein
MADKLVTIAKYANYMQAELAKQMLANCGIEAIVGGENANVYSLIPTAGCELQVLESKAKEAMEILETMESTPAENVEMPEDTESDLDQEDEDN